MGAGGIVLLASMFLLPWYGVTLGAGPGSVRHFVTVSVDGWHGLMHLRWLILLTILAAVALVLLQATRRPPALPTTASVLVTIVGGLTAALLIYRVLINEPGAQKVGALLGLISACAIFYGGYASMREEGISPKDERAEIPAVRLGDGSGPRISG